MREPGKPELVEIGDEQAVVFQDADACHPRHRG